MTLYAISDLHLSLSVDKPMDIFGKGWENHMEKIKENWIGKVKEEDVVLIPGDISWSMKPSDGINDLKWIEDLPGRKIIIKGNHDYWWTSIKKLNSINPKMQFLQNNFFNYKDYAICGIRGWNIPNNIDDNSHDAKIYKREIIRLRLSLESAKKAGYTKFIVMTHYPPLVDEEASTGISEMLQEYGVELCIYGHLHSSGISSKVEGNVNGVEYKLTSCDYIDFDPIILKD